MGIGNRRERGGMLGRQQARGQIPRGEGRRWEADGKLGKERAAGAAPVALSGRGVVGQNAWPHSFCSKLSFPMSRSLVCTSLPSVLARRGYVRGRYMLLLFRSLHILLCI